MRVLVLDNYDSFTFNLVQYLGELGADPITIRNDVNLKKNSLRLVADEEHPEEHEGGRVDAHRGVGVEILFRHGQRLRETHRGDRDDGHVDGVEQALIPQASPAAEDPSVPDGDGPPAAEGPPVQDGEGPPAAEDPPVQDGEGPPQAPPTP